MGLLSFLSPSSHSATNASTNNNDSRRVNSSSGDGITAQDGGAVNITMTDSGAMDLASRSVAQSLDMANQIARTLGASVGNYTSGAINTVDSFTHLADQHQANVQQLGENDQQITMVALAVAGLVAVMALRHR